MTTPVKLIVYSILSGLVVLLIGLGAGTTHTAEAGAFLSFPKANCSSGSSASVTFAWQTQSGAREQWLDISTVDNGFAPGTFTGQGPIPVGTTSLNLPGFTPGTAVLWRVNTLTSDGWLPSDTGAFVPCGSPVLLWGPMTCNGAFNVNVSFHWAPLADGNAFQFIDVGSSPDFLPGTYSSTNQLWAAASTFQWVNLRANGTYYFRVRAQTNDGTHYSTVASFRDDCAPAAPNEIYGSADRLVGPGINADVNVRDVWFDGALGDPIGPWDVVRYNFDLFPNSVGYPGNGGTTLIAGHVDYHDCGGGIPCLSVFAPLRDTKVGDVFTYYRGDGTALSYVVDWAQDFPTNYDWNSLIVKGGDSIVLLTCDGIFNFATREYDHRRAVHLVRAIS